MSHSKYHFAKLGSFILRNISQKCLLHLLVPNHTKMFNLAVQNWPRPLIQSDSSHPLTNVCSSVRSPWAMQNSLLYVTPQSITHYIITVHNAINFAAVLGFVCNKAVILQLHWRKSVVWFMSNSARSYWNVHNSIKNLRNYLMFIDPYIVI